eukprot:12612687-Prorocentrum_lima.AAC.1
MARFAFVRLGHERIAKGQQQPGDGSFNVGKAPERSIISCRVGIICQAKVNRCCDMWLTGR